MLTVICITILAYCLLGNKVEPLVEKVKDFDWKGLSGQLLEKLRDWARKAGRVAARPLLQFYYVMTDDNTSTLDKALVYAAIIYTISPVSLLPAAVYKLLGILDEGAAVYFVYSKIKDHITPEINAKVDATILEWFGVEYSVIHSETLEED